MRNIPTLFGITHRGYGCECEFYERSILISICIVTKFFCVGGGLYKHIWVGEEISKWLGGN